MSSSNTRAGQSLELRVLNTNHACEISSDTSSSTRKRNHESKMEGRKKLIKLLEERLRILEEEDEILKGEFMRSMKERTQLFNEVRQHLENLQYYLRLRSQKSGDLSPDGVSDEALKREGLAFYKSCAKNHIHHF